MITKTNELLCALAGVSPGSNLKFIFLHGPQRASGFCKHNIYFG
jgi:hypothetical protein